MEDRFMTAVLERDRRTKRILLSGVSGAGKSTMIRQMAELGYAALDLDIFGKRIAMPDGTLKWVVRSEAVRMLDRTLKCDLILGGISQNLFSEVRGLRMTEELNFDSQDWEFVQPIVSAIEWDAKVWLKYTPTEEALNLRFGPSRENNYGKTPKQRERVKINASQPAPNGWIVVDTDAGVQETLFGLINVLDELEVYRQLG